MVLCEQRSSTLSDGAGGTATAALTVGPIAAVNDAPVAANDTIAVTENFAGTGNVLGNDSDLDGDGLFVTQFVVNGITYAAGATASFAEGVLVIGSDGAVTFNPALDYNGPVPAVTYTISDGAGGLASATLTLGPVVSVNDAPAGTDTTLSAIEDTAYLFSAADFGFTDPNDAPANGLQSVIITSLPASGVLTLGGVAVVAGQTIPAAQHCHVGVDAASPCQRSRSDLLHLPDC